MAEVDTDTMADLLHSMKKVESKLGELVLMKRFEMLGPDKVLNFLCEDAPVKMFLPDADMDFIQRGLLLSRRFFELNMLKRAEKFIPDDAVVYDLGANIGNHSVYFGLICKAAKVVAFEAQSHCYDILQKNLELNGLSRATGHHCLLGKDGGTADMGHQNMGNLGATSFEPSDAGTGAVQMQALDTFGCKEKRLDFMKIDVEGMQIQVLEGALGTLKKHKPVMWIELRPKFDEVTETTEFLAQYGYEMREKLSPNDFIFVAD